jgi:hypothetical protein
MLPEAKTEVVENTQKFARFERNYSLKVRFYFLLLPQFLQKTNYYEFITCILKTDVIFVQLEVH